MSGDVMQIIGLVLNFALVPILTTLYNINGRLSNIETQTQWRFKAIEDQLRVIEANEKVIIRGKVEA